MSARHFFSKFFSPFGGCNAILCFSQRPVSNAVPRENEILSAFCEEELVLLLGHIELHLLAQFSKDRFQIDLSLGNNAFQTLSSLHLKWNPWKEKGVMAKPLVRQKE